MTNTIRKQIHLAFCLILVIQYTQCVHADIVKIAAVDSTRTDQGAPNTPIGGSVLAVQKYEYGHMRSLVRFDLSSIPAGATINSADLNLVTEDSYGNAWEQLGGVFTSVHALTKDWDSSATWNSAATGVPWSSPGGDFVSAPVAINSDDVVGAGHSLQWDITALVSEWSSGSRTNYGVLMKGSWGNELHFYSHSDPQGPKLKVDYNPVPEPCSVTLVAIGLGSTMVGLRRRHANKKN